MIEKIYNPYHQIYIVQQKMTHARNPHELQSVFIYKSSIWGTFPFGGFLQSMLSKNPNKVTPWHPARK